MKVESRWIKNTQNMYKVQPIICNMYTVITIIWITQLITADVTSYILAVVAIEAIRGWSSSLLRHDITFPSSPDLARLLPFVLTRFLAGCESVRNRPAHRFVKVVRDQQGLTNVRQQDKIDTRKNVCEGPGEGRAPVMTFSGYILWSPQK